MKSKFSVAATLLLVASCWAVPKATTPSDAELDDLIKEVFQSGPSNGNVVVEKNPNIPDRNGADNGNGNCECVPYYQCQNDTIIDNGIGLIDIRLQGECEHYLDVCCRPPNMKPPSEKPTPSPPSARVGCGKHNPNGVGFRITDAKDNEAQFGEFPWMVAILKEEAIGDQGRLLNVYQCGGALIHPKVVLTAAHCVNGKAPSVLKVRAGEWDTQTKKELFPHQDRQVSNVAVHEGFHSGSLVNDFALLLLSQPVDIIDNVDVVCLPDFNTRFDLARCFASGWGKDVFGKEGHYQVILKKVELPVVPHDACQYSLRTTRLGKYFVLDDSFICAGGEPGKDTCRGDGGSPLVCPIPGAPGRLYQAGIVAWGIGCGENQIPGVYGNVAYARPWIDQQMAYWNLDPREYQYHL